MEQDEEISVGLSDGSSVPATLVGRDPTTDLALLRVKTAGLTPLAWANVDGLRVGHLVLALGRPGRSVRATLGIISALGGSWRTAAGGPVSHYMETDVVMLPGFSGGPLIGSDGKVVGLNTTALVRGMNIAIPLPSVNTVVEALLAHGRIPSGYIGVGLQPVRLPLPLAQQLGQQTGLLIVSVEPGSPGEKARLMLGDVLVTLGDQPLRQIDDLLAFLRGEQAGKALPVRLVRGGQLLELTVTVGERS